MGINSGFKGLKHIKCEITTTAAPILFGQLQFLYISAP